MTERDKFRTGELKQERLERVGYKCEVCGEPINPGDFAHKVPQAKWALKKYGADCIHHPNNLVLVCGSRCNHSLNISGYPVECDRLMAEIKGGNELFR